jgi:cytochrome oxidase Cu insertion factor (SCO1/SenC/PrrC family)
VASAANLRAVPRHRAVVGVQGAVAGGDANGLGFQWPGHATAAAAAERRLAGIRVAAGGSGLVAATTTAVRQLATVSGARLSGSAAAAAANAGASSGGAAPSGGAGSGAQGGPKILSSGGGATSVIVIVSILAALIVAVLVVLLIARRAIHLVARPPLARSAGPSPSGGGWRAPLWTLPSLAVIAAAGLVALMVSAHASSSQPVSDLANTPNLDPGSPLPDRPAPNFALYDQFGQRVTLHQYRGKVVLLAFIDSECTTLCPLTTTAMLDAKRLLGAAGKQVQLLGVDADPEATQIEDVLSYSQLHGLTHAWQFGTGTLGQLASVWKHYFVRTDVQDGLISHTAALFVIDPQGRERKLYTTVQSYTAVPQLGQLLAHEASRLLPSHPAVASHLSYGQVPTVLRRSELSCPARAAGRCGSVPARTGCTRSLTRGCRR